jgi:hypothetical protein
MPSEKKELLLVNASHSDPARSILPSPDGWIAAQLGLSGRDNGILQNPLMTLIRLCIPGKLAASADRRVRGVVVTIGVADFGTLRSGITNDYYGYCT